MNVSKVTHIDYAILGLVKESPKSGYKIRMIFERTALGNFSSSPGTIYPAIKRLEKLRLVEKKKQAEGKGQALFSITKSGSTKLKAWLHKPIIRADVAKNLNLLVLRFGFMDGSSSIKDMRAFLESFKLATSKYIAELEEFYMNESLKLPMAGRLAFEHGIASYKTTLTWCKTSQLQITKLNKK